MTTALDLITDALEIDGIYAPGETISSADSARGLTVLNDMIDSWSNDSLAVYARTEISKVLTIGDSQYTVGSGGDINVTRPLRVLDGYGAAYVVDSNSNRYPLEVVQQDRWNLIANIVTVNSDVPTTLFYDPQYPLGVINLYPVPSQAYTLYFDALLQLTTLVSLTTSISLPPGYERAIKRNLALELWPYFKGIDKVPPQPLVRAAALALGAIKRTNSKPVVAIYDPALLVYGGRAADIYRGA